MSAGSESSVSSSTETLLEPPLPVLVKGQLHSQHWKSQSKVPVTTEDLSINKALRTIGNAAIIQRSLQLRHPLPGIVHERWAKFRFATFTFYHRWMAFCILTNLVFLGLLAGDRFGSASSFNIQAAATATGANLLASTMMRHERFINLWFGVIVRLPQSAPLKLRWTLGKLAYNQGGVHAGTGISALLCYICYMAYFISEGGENTTIDHAIVVLGGFMLGIFLLLILASHPRVRQKYHDFWEASHRYGGWTAVLIVWGQTLLTSVQYGSHTVPVWLRLIRTPNFWFLCVMSFFIVHPWLYLRRVPVIATRLSSHATRFWFSKKVMPTARGLRIAKYPFSDYHGFATIPNPDLEQGFSILISRAGDFTGEMVDNPPKYVWIKGAPTTGVIRVATMFKRLVVVATGSGIGPCLSFLQAFPNYPLRVIWSARDPLKTYGEEIIRSVLLADRSAIIIDTQKDGHPKLLDLSYAVQRDSDAEAVVIISNPKVTQQVVYGLEARGVPAFGAIFDS